MEYWMWFYVVKRKITVLNYVYMRLEHTQYNTYTYRHKTILRKILTKHILKMKKTVESWQYNSKQLTKYSQKQAALAIFAENHFIAFCLTESTICVCHIRVFFFAFPLLRFYWKSANAEHTLVPRFYWLPDVKL